MAKDYLAVTIVELLLLLFGKVGAVGGGVCCVDFGVEHAGVGG